MPYYDYEHIETGRKFYLEDEYIDRKTAQAQGKVIRELGITADHVKFKDVLEDVAFDGMTGTELRFLVSDDEEPLQWLIVFFDHFKSLLRIYSEPYLGG